MGARDEPSNCSLPKMLLGAPARSISVGITSTSSTTASETRAGLAGSRMMRGTRAPSSKFVNFCHSPCSPSDQP